MTFYLFSLHQQLIAIILIHGNSMATAEPQEVIHWYNLYFGAFAIFILWNEYLFGSDKQKETNITVERDPNKHLDGC